MKNIIIIGSSGQARVVIDIVEREGRFKITGLIDRFRKVGEETLGYSVLGGEMDIPHIMSTHTLDGAIVAVGDNFARCGVVRWIHEICPSLPFVTAIHPSASMGTGVTIGEGSVVMAGAVVNSCATVGQHCVLNTNCSLDHDSKLGDFASLAPGVVTGGYCEIGRCSAICIGATLMDRIHVGEHSVVGAGSLVIKPIESYVVAFGSPARTIRARQAGDRYL